MTVFWPDDLPWPVAAREVITQWTAKVLQKRSQGQRCHAWHQLGWALGIRAWQETGHPGVHCVTSHYTLVHSFDNWQELHSSHWKKSEYKAITQDLHNRLFYTMSQKMTQLWNNFDDIWQKYSKHLEQSLHVSVFMYICFLSTLKPGTENANFDAISLTENTASTPSVNMTTVPNFLNFTINAVLRPTFIQKLCYKLPSVVTFTFIQIFDQNFFFFTKRRQSCRVCLTQRQNSRYFRCVRFERRKVDQKQS